MRCATNTGKPIPQRKYFPRFAWQMYMQNAAAAIKHKLYQLSRKRVARHKGCTEEQLVLEWHSKFQAPKVGKGPEIFTYLGTAVNSEVLDPAALDTSY